MEAYSHVSTTHIATTLQLILQIIESNMFQILKY